MKFSKTLTLILLTEYHSEALLIPDIPHVHHAAAVSIMIVGAKSLKTFLVFPTLRQNSLNSEPMVLLADLPAFHSKTSLRSAFQKHFTKEYDSPSTHSRKTAVSPLASPKPSLIYLESSFFPFFCYFVADHCFTRRFATSQRTSSSSSQKLTSFNFGWFSKHLVSCWKTVVVVCSY